MKTFKEALAPGWLAVFEANDETDGFVYNMPADCVLAKECLWFMEQIDAMIKATNARESGGLEKDLTVSFREVAFAQMMVWVYG